MKRSVDLLIDFLAATHPGMAYRIVLHDYGSAFAQENNWSVVRGYALIVVDRADGSVITAHPTLTDGASYELNTHTGKISYHRIAA